MATTSRGYTYPASTGHNRIWEHLQTLATDLNSDVQAIVNRRTERPFCKVSQSSGQTIPHAADTVVQFQTEDYDAYNFHSTSLNIHRLTPTVAGWYTVRGKVMFPTKGYGVIGCCIRKNGVELPSWTRIDAPGAASRSVDNEILMVSCNGTTDYIDMICYQTNTPANQVVLPASGSYTSTLEMLYQRAL